MSAVYSKPEEILSQKLYEYTFLNSGYKYDSGGIPQDIVKLSYADFIAAHKKYYHPSNSLLYLYGDLDINKYLHYIDEHCLNAFDYKNNDVPIIDEPPFNNPILAKEKTPYISNEKRYYGFSLLFSEYTNPKLIMTLEALSMYLFRTNASLLKNALLSNEIGEEIVDEIDFHMQKPLLKIIVKDSKKTLEDFKNVLISHLEAISKKGLDKELMESCLNKLEFRLKEENYGYRPKGLHYNIILLTNWLYGNDPFACLNRLQTLTEIRNSINKNYFEDFIEKHILNNNHKVWLELCREEEADHTEAAHLLPIEEIVEKSIKLKAYHDKEDSLETLDKIPLIHINEIDKTIENTPIEIKKYEALDIYHSAINTNDIAYINFVFDTGCLPQKLIQPMGVLLILLSRLSTKNFSFEELNKKMSYYLGGFGFGFTVYQKTNTKDYSTKIIVYTKSLVKDAVNAFKLVYEIIYNTVFTDKKRIEALLREHKSKMETYMITNGNDLSIARLKSYYFDGFKYSDYVTSIEFYSYLTQLLTNFDLEFDKLVNEFQNSIQFIFTKQNFLAHIIVDSFNFNSMSKHMIDFYKDLSETIHPITNYTFENTDKNEAFITASQVNYNCAAFMFSNDKTKYSGYLTVLSNILSSAYLMDEIRIKGGAYGTGCNFSNYGMAHFYSYRDPHLKRTYGVYNNINQYLENLKLTQKDIDKYRIGSINQYYRPKHISQKAQLAFSLQMCEISNDDYARHINEIFETNLSILKDISHVFDNFSDNHLVCSFGNKDKITASKEIFSKIYFE